MLRHLINYIKLIRFLYLRYYAAPSTTDSTSQYNSTRQQNDTDTTDNAASNLYAEIIDEQVHQADTDEMSHHYIELE